MSFQLEAPMRIYSEDSIRKRKLMSGDEKPTRKYTKAIKEEIKKEPFELSDNDDIDGDDVMDIEEADGTLPKKGKLGVVGAKKRIMKTKKVKKVLKTTDQKDQKDIKPKPKRKKKPQLVQPVGSENINVSSSTLTITTTTQTVNSKSNANQPTSEPSKSARKSITKPKEKKIKQKVQKIAQKGSKDDTKTHQQHSQHNNSDSDSSPEESDAYETCGVLNCTRPSGKANLFSLIYLSQLLSSSESVQDWILCDGGCEVWYHMVCVGLKIKEVKPDLEFICKRCKDPVNA